MFYAPESTFSTVGLDLPRSVTWLFPNYFLSYEIKLDVSLVKLRMAKLMCEMRLVQSGGPH